MRIIHPQTEINGFDPRNVFFALDDLDNQIGAAMIYYQVLPGLYPDCPVTIYFSLEGQNAARYLLFGAVIARAQQIQKLNPQVPAWLYTSISPADNLTKDFYLHNGFDRIDTDDTLLLSMPYGDGRVPMSCHVEQTMLNTDTEQMYFLNRLDYNGVCNVNLEQLNNLQHMPHFLTLGIYRNGNLIGECLMAGQGYDCDLVAIYIEPGSRQQGMGKALLHRSMAVMAAEGVTRVYTRIMTRSRPQQGLMNAFNPRVIGVNNVFPGMMIGLK